MTALGVTVLAATLLLLAAQFFRRRSRRFPAWGWLGLAALCAAEALMFRGVEPVATYFTPIAWTSYILVADAAVFALRGRSRLHDAPLRLAQEAALSVPLWLIFEAYNLRLANWIYVGLPASLPARWFGYGWAFATIFPAIFLTADLIESFGWWQRPAAPLRFSQRTRRSFVAVGIVLLAAPLVVPRPAASFLFGLVWLGFLFLLDPLNFALGLPSLEGDLAVGRRGRLFSLLAAGWVCGWLWEFWNYWAAAKWIYIFPILQKHKIFEMPAPGYLGFLPFALECFVMYGFAAWLLRWEKPAREGAHPEPSASGNAVPATRPRMLLAAMVGIALAAVLLPSTARAAGLDLPPGASHGLNLLYSGQTDQAIADFRQLQAAHPDDPLGYILEADARWWQIYCEACEIKWNMIDAWHRSRLPSDKAYLALTDKAIHLAQDQIAKGDSAKMELYAGLAWMLRARLMALLNDRRGTAHAGVEARAAMLRCLQLDPQMADADTGLGLYNYYVDTLSPIVKILSFLMGIPGGNKKEGIHQMEIGMRKGVLTRVEARFYLAKNLRTYQQDYTQAIAVMTPLVTQYPQNAVFRLLLGGMQAKLGHNRDAEASFRRAEQLPVPGSACAARIHAVAQQALKALPAH